MPPFELRKLSRALFILDTHLIRLSCNLCKLLLIHLDTSLQQDFLFAANRD